MIAISAMLFSCYTLRIARPRHNSLGTVDDKTQDRRQGNATPSGDGEDHQAKSTEEYSTEYGCRSGRGCLLTHKVHPPSLQDVQQYKVR